MDSPIITSIMNIGDITKKDIKFAEMALYYAKLSNMKEKHGCVLVMNGNIKSHGINSDRVQSSDKLGLLRGTFSTHAEIDAIKKIYKPYEKDYKTFKKSSLYVVRVIKSDILTESAPCERCTRFLKMLNIKYIIHSNQSGGLTKKKVKNYNSDHICKGAISLKRLNIIN